MTDSSSFKLGTFSIAGCAPFPGVLVDERVIALQAVIGECATLLELLEDWDRNFGILSEVAASIRAQKVPELRRQARPVDELDLHAPIPRPGTVYCSGANYKKHVVDLIVAHQDQAETRGMSLEQKRAWGMKLMDERAANGTPFIFIKPQSTVTGPFDPIVVPYDAEKPDWELELAVVIGRRARRVSRTVASLIEYLSSGVELQPGDVICTGSPAGNGMHYNRFIQDGDVLEGSIIGPAVGLGTQRNSCILEKR